MISALTTVAITARPALVARRADRQGRVIATSARVPTVVARRSAVVVRAEPEEKSSIDTEALSESAGAVVEDVKAKWEATEEKPAAIALALAGFVAVWAASGVVGAVDKLPVIGDLFELIGLLVTGWFVYRYLLFGPDRAELKTKVDGFVGKMTGK